MCVRLREFVTSYSDCFERTLQIGHVTGSAWVVNLDYTRVLLTHHAKLGKWLQLGGHADGDPDLPGVALREAREESGLSRIAPVSESIFDVDIHLIPARQPDPAHYHYDVRFLLQADSREDLRISSESRDLRWVEIARVAELAPEESMLRLVRKTRPWIPALKSRPNRAG